MAKKTGMFKVGAWDTARRMIVGMKGDIEKTNTLVLARVGAKTEKLLVKQIKRQPGSWAKLNDQYRKSKLKKGRSGLKLRATSTMINSITSVATPDSVFAGVRRQKRYNDGTEVAKIAEVMEYGSKARGIPARPFFRPVHKLMLRKIRREKLFVKMYMEVRRKKYGI